MTAIYRFRACPRHLRRLRLQRPSANDRGNQGVFSRPRRWADSSRDGVSDPALELMYYVVPLPASRQRLVMSSSGAQPPSGTDVACCPILSSFRPVHLFQHLRQRLLADLPLALVSSRSSCGANARGVSSLWECKCFPSPGRSNAQSRHVGRLLIAVLWLGFQRLRVGAWQTVAGIGAAGRHRSHAWLATPASSSSERVAASPHRDRAERLRTISGAG